MVKAEEARKLIEESIATSERIWKAFADVGKSISTSVTYLYPKSQMKVTRILYLPPKRRELLRRIARKEVSFSETDGFKIINIFDLETGTAIRDATSFKNGKYILDYSKLSKDSEKFMITTVNKVTPELLRMLLDVRISEVSSREEKEREKHWIVAAMKDRGESLRPIYSSATLEDVEVNVGIDVDKYYNTGLKSYGSPVFKLMKATSDMLKGIDQGNRELEAYGKRIRKGMLEGMRHRKKDIFDELSALCTAHIFRKYISIDNPDFEYVDARKTESLMTIGKMQIPIPSGMNVLLYATLNYDEPARKGFLTFEKENFNQDVEKVIKRFFKDSALE